MPKVPTIQEGQRLAPQNPTGFQSSSQARLTGEAIKGVGRGLASLGDAMGKARDANKSIVREDTRTTVANSLRDLNAKYAQKGYSPENKAEYEKEKRELLTGIKTQLEKEHGSDYAKLIEVTGEGEESRWTEKFTNTNNKGFLNNLSNNIKKMESAYSSQAESEPDNADIIKARAAQEMFEMGKSLGLSEERSLESVKRVEQGITRSQIEGYMAQQSNEGFFMARKALKESGEMFTSEERKKIKDDIDDTQRTVIRFNNYQEDRMNRELEREERQRSELVLNNLVMEVEKAAEANDPVAFNKATKKAYNQAKQGNLTNQHFGKFLTSSDKNFKEIDQASKFRVRSVVYNGGESKDFAKGRDMVHSMVNRGAMLSSTASNLLKEFAQQQKAFDSDPIFKQNYKAALAKMDQILGGQTAIEKMLVKYDSQKLREQLTKIHGAKAMFHELIANNAKNGGTPDPMFAALTALNAVDYQGLLQQSPGEGVPQYTKPLVKSTVADFVEYDKQLEEYENTTGRYDTPMKRFEVHTHRRRIQAQIRIMNSREDMERVRQQRLDQEASNRDNSARIMGLDDPQESVNYILKDIESLHQPDEHGVPYIYRLQEPEY